MYLRAYLRLDNRLEKDRVHRPKQLRVKVLQGEESVLVSLAGSRHRHRRLRLLGSGAKRRAVQGAAAAAVHGASFVGREVAQACQPDRWIGGGLVECCFHA